MSQQNVEPLSPAEPVVEEDSQRRLDPLAKRYDGVLHEHSATTEDVRVEDVGPSSLDRMAADPSDVEQEGYSGRRTSRSGPAAARPPEQAKPAVAEAAFDDNVNGRDKGTTGSETVTPRPGTAPE